VAQPVDEPFEDIGVVEQDKSWLVVDLESDDRGMRGVARHHGADDALGVAAEQWLRVVDLLPRAPTDPMPGRRLGGDLGIPAGQPHRDGVRRRAENRADSSFVGGIEDRLEPVQLEPTVLRFPRRPDGFTDSNDREAGLRHQVEVRLEVGLADTRRNTLHRSGCRPLPVGAAVPEVGEANGASDAYSPITRPVRTTQTSDVQ
jgi:hypothetical protein